MVDIFANASVERYVKTLQVLLEDPQSAVIALLHAPTAATPSADIAQAIGSVAQQASHNLFACWLGGDGMTEARRITREAGVPTYDTSEEVVGAFRHLVSYRRNQESMLQIPASIASEFTPDSARAGALVEKALAAGRDHLSELEQTALLAAYGIRVAEERVARTRDEAVQVARGLGYPVIVKILLADVRRGPEVGGAAQDLDSDNEVRAAIAQLRKRVRQRRLEARLKGLIVKKMAPKRDAHPLVVGVVTDPVFGPVIVLAQGNVASTSASHLTVGLPPLNMGARPRVDFAHQVGNALRSQRGGCIRKMGCCLPHTRAGITDDYEPAPDRGIGD